MDNYDSHIATYITNRILDRPSPLFCSFCEIKNKNEQCDNFCYYNIQKYFDDLIDSYDKPNICTEEAITFKELDYTIDYLMFCKSFCTSCKYMSDKGCKLKIRIANILACKIYIKSIQKCDNEPCMQNVKNTIKPRVYWDADYGLFRETYVGVLPPCENTLLLETMLSSHRFRDFQKYEGGYEGYAYMYDDLSRKIIYRRAKP